MIENGKAVSFESLSPLAMCMHCHDTVVMREIFFANKFFDTVVRLRLLYVAQSLLSLCVILSFNPYLSLRVSRLIFISANIKAHTHSIQCKS